MHRPPSRLRTNLRLCVAEGIFAMPLVYLNQLAGNAVLTLLLTGVYGFRESLLGIVAAMPALFNVLQMAISAYLSRWWPQKRLTVVFCWVNWVAWVVFAACLSFVPPEEGRLAAKLFIVLFAVISLGNAVMSIAWTSWVQEWLPERIRGKFFGVRNRLLQLSTVSFLLLVSAALEFAPEGERLFYYQAIIAVAVTVRTLSILNLQRILSHDDLHLRRETQLDWTGQLRVIRAHRSLVWFLVFGAAWGFATTLVGPFLNVFLLEVAKVPGSTLLLLNVVGTLTGAISLPAWGRLLDRYGSRPVMIVTLVLWMVPSFAWFFVAEGRYHFLFVLFATGGIFGAGFLLGQFGLLLKLVPAEAKTTAISLYAAITATMAFLAPILGGALLEQAWRFGWRPDVVYPWASLLHHLLVLATALILVRVVEPRSAELSQVVGAMRSARQIAAILGVGAFLNYVFFRRRPDAP